MPHFSTAFAPRSPGRTPTSLNHHTLLELCYAYRRLYSRTKELQTQIDTAIATYQSAPGRPPSSPTLATLLDTLSTLDAGLRLELIDDFYRIELETQKWENKSAKLRHEAKRQQRLREQRREYAAAHPAPADYTYLPPGTDPFAEPAAATAATPIAPSPTMRRALAGLRDLPPADLPDDPDTVQPRPDTSGYRKSGLV